MSLTLYKIKEKEVVLTNELNLENDMIYIIVDRRKKKPKIWIWTGTDARKDDKYYAGMAATKIKSKEKLYGASIEHVESGDEPKSFLAITKKKIIEPSEEEKAELEIAIATPEPQIKSKINATSVEVSQPMSSETAEKQDVISPLKVKSLLKDITITLETLRNKISKFFEEL